MNYIQLYVIVSVMTFTMSEGMKRWKKGGKKFGRENIDNILSRDCRFWKNPYKQHDLLTRYRPSPPSLYYYWDIEKQICSSCRSCQREGFVTVKPCSFFSNTVCTDRNKQEAFSSYSWADSTNDDYDESEGAGEAGQVKFQSDFSPAQQEKEEVYGQPVFGISDSLQSLQVQLCDLVTILFILDPRFRKEN
ncbi:uncharacterized protein LOC111717673 [Eurytemora carolleeae]|uniref:uncharacterized protein LOC111717673 n=1 Tax=Eurytemora carolleeae TaxID=1294199 RepID=UPI000C75677F|nr:uncharacterized protein LOC111717673 [Eurytemora carolleeae]|eukprot:XP_023348932.1 uncharacterized protein LOC111717673 [Eurytemora affinis]